MKKERTSKEQQRKGEKETGIQGDSTEVEKMSYERLIVIIHLFVLAVIMRWMLIIIGWPKLSSSTGPCTSWIGPRAVITCDCQQPEKQESQFSSWKYFLLHLWKWEPGQEAKERWPSGNKRRSSRLDSGVLGVPCVESLDYTLWLCRRG